MRKCIMGLVLVLMVPGWLTYTDTAGKYSIDYPKEWTKMDIPGGVALLAPKGPNENFNESVVVIIQDLADHPMTLDQFTELNRKQLADQGATATIRPTKLAGENAGVVTYAKSYQGRSLKLKNYWFVKNQKAYVLTYAANTDQFARDEGTATQMIRSFRLNHR